MTEKRFSRHIDFFIDNKRTSDKLMNMDEVVDLLNEQHETIQRLEEQLKNSHMNEICEVCKHGKYSVDWYGEGEFECLKRHFGVDDWKYDGLKECDDFELDDKVYLND